MKKGLKILLIMLVVLLRMNLDGNTQSPNDTICLPVADAQNKIAAFKQRPILLEQIELLKKEISLMNQRISYKDSIIAAYLLKEDNNIEIVADLREQIQLTKQEVALKKDQVEGYERLLKREKRRHRWTKIGATLLTGIGAYLYLTK